MKRIHSTNSIFLMEIILNVLLFCLLLVVGLQFFLQAHTQTEQTKLLHQAVTSCESVASLFQNGDGTLDGLSADCQYSTKQDRQIRIYLDDDFLFCPKQDASYYIIGEFSESDSSMLTKLRITCCTMSEEELYAITACHYTPFKCARLGETAKGVR